MRWVLTYVCPPLAVLLCGKPFTSILTLFLTILGWKPGVRHAQFVLNQHLDDKRARGIAKATNHPAWVQDIFPQKAEPHVRQLKPGIEVIEQPDVGMHGTRFRKREELN